jgi:hypothetical protein
MPEFSVMARDSSDDTVHLTTEQEIANLRDLLAEKEEALSRAEVSTADLRQEIAHLRTETELLRAQLEIARERPDSEVKIAVNEAVFRLTSQFRQAQKAIEREHNLVRAELVTGKARWETTQRQLESERITRQMESVRSADKIASLESELAAAAMAAQVSHQTSVRGRMLRTRLTVAAVAVVFLAGLLVAWLQWRGKAKHETASTPDQTAVVAPRYRASSLVSDHQFPGAIGRLNDALAAFPGKTPEQVLREVRHRFAKTDPSVCAIEWNGGQPAVMFGGGAMNSLTSTLTNCAKAVESVRAR